MPDNAPQPGDAPDEAGKSGHQSDQPRRRTQLVEGVIAIVFVAVISLGASSGFIAATEQTTRHRAEWITLDLGAPGSVEIVATANDAITVEKQIRDLWGTVTTSEQVQEAALQIRSRCANRWITILSACRVDYLVQAPTATGIAGTATNGHVDIQRMSAPIDEQATDTSPSATTQAPSIFGPPTGTSRWQTQPATSRR